MDKITLLLYTNILTFTIGIVYYIQNTEYSTPTEPQNWDILIFTQTWPNTLCYALQSEYPGRTCNLPSQKNLWTVSSIRPLKKLNILSPVFCNESLSFDPKLLTGIQQDLDYYWTDIEIQFNNIITKVNSTKTISRIKDSIWYRKWEKCGTCVVDLPALNSQFKYFNQGIQWSKQYNMKYILEQGGINVNSSLNITDYWNATMTVLKTNAWIECSYKPDTKQQMLVEISICFDKNLNLTDCDVVEKYQMKSKKIYPLTNCELKKPILYLDYVPE